MGLRRDKPGDRIFRRRARIHHLLAALLLVEAAALIFLAPEWVVLLPVLLPAAYVLGFGVGGRLRTVVATLFMLFVGAYLWPGSFFALAGACGVVNTYCSDAALFAAIAAYLAALVVNGASVWVLFGKAEPQAESRSR